MSSIPFSFSSSLFITTQFLFVFFSFCDLVSLVSVLNGSIYEYVSTTEDYYGARDYCRDNFKFGHLVTIESVEENDFVYPICQTSRCTIGIYYSYGGGNHGWRLVDDYSTEIVYENFFDTKDDYFEQYVHISSSSGGWYSVDNDNTYGSFICEYPCSDSSCSGVGCLIAGNCSCPNFAHGETCEQFMCYGYWQNDTERVCGGRGRCRGVDICECYNSTGDMCQTEVCFGDDENAWGVCRNHGECTGYNECNCDSDLYYPERGCGWDCFGLIGEGYYDEGCSYQGVCVDHNTCDCRKNYGGIQCQSRVFSTHESLAITMGVFMFSSPMILVCFCLICCVGGIICNLAITFLVTRRIEEAKKLEPKKTELEEISVGEKKREKLIQNVSGHESSSGKEEESELTSSEENDNSSSVSSDEVSKDDSSEEEKEEVLVLTTTNKDEYTKKIPKNNETVAKSYLVKLCFGNSSCWVVVCLCIVFACVLIVLLIGGCIAGYVILTIACICFTGDCGQCWLDLFGNTKTLHPIFVKSYHLGIGYKVEDFWIDQCTAMIQTGVHGKIMKCTDQMNSIYALKFVNKFSNEDLVDESYIGEIHRQKECNEVVKIYGYTDIGYDVIENNENYGNIALVMEYLGENVLDLYEFMGFDTFHYLQPGDILEIVLKLASSINEVHEMGIIHNDFTLTNVLTNNVLDWIKICDFGLSSYFHLENRTSYNTLLLEQGFGFNGIHVAPEIAHYNQFSSKSDIFSLGLMVYELTHGRWSIFTYALKRKLLGRKLWVDELDRPQITVEYARSIIEWCWQQNPQERPTADELMVFIKDELIGNI